MLEALKSLIANPQREARQLNRDASTIIDSAIASLPVNRVRETALLTLEQLAEIGDHLQEHSQYREQILNRYRQLHGEARRRMDQVGLTAYTLIIIYLRAAALGEMAAPAREAIDEFTGHWAHAAQSEN